MEILENTNEPEIADWMFSEQYNIQTELEVNKMKFTDQEVIKKLYYIMKNIDQIFLQNNIQYWSAFGTTLGCIRHNGIIPWDDDLDICIKESDVQKLVNKDLKQQLQEKNLSLSKVDFGYKIYISESNIINQKFKDKDTEDYGFPFCDIFVMEFKKKKWIIKDRGSQKTNSNEIYKQKQIENIKRHNFGDFQINVPDNIEEYLNLSYGENWATEAKTHFWDHVNQRIMKPEIIQLTPELLQPAKPFN